MLRRKCQSIDMLSRVRCLLTAKGTNRLYKSMILPVFDYSDMTWHNSGKGNSEILERLQRRPCGIVYRNASSNEVSTDNILHDWVGRL